MRQLSLINARKKPPPLHMIICGEGGTGKSKVLQTVTEAFQQQNSDHHLLKAAYTGMAVSLINGKMTHVIGALSVAGHNQGDRSVSNKTRSELEKIWTSVWFLALDEISMLAKDFFANLSRNAAIGKQCADNHSFGGVNIIILGNFHQFPPVAHSIRDALFYPNNSEMDSSLSMIGRAIYEELTIVVILKEQKRITDTV